MGTIVFLRKFIIFLFLVVLSVTTNLYGQADSCTGSGEAGLQVPVGTDEDAIKVIDASMRMYDYREALDMIDAIISEDAYDSLKVAVMPPEEKLRQKELFSRRAQCLRKLYRYEDAVEALGRVMALGGGSVMVPVMAEIADCRIQQGNTAEALNIYGLVTMMDPENLYFLVQQTVLFYHCGMFADCIANAGRVMARDSIPAVISLAGDSYNMLGQPDSALVFYRKALSSNPYNARVVDKASNILLNQKRYGEVIGITGKCLERDSSINILGIRGLAYYLMGEYGNSVKVFERMRKMGDSSAATCFYLGLNYLEGNNLEKAGQVFKEACKADSTDVESVYYYAYVMGLTAGQDSVTRNLYEKAIAMMQPDPARMYRYHSGYADWLLRKESYQDAVGHYMKARSYEPDKITLLPSLGYCHERMKDWSRAAECYSEFLENAKSKESDAYNFAKEALDYVNSKLFMEE